MTNKIARIQNRYDKLSNKERLQLAVSAIERGDNQDLEFIFRTAPRKTYTMPDDWITDRYEAIWKISVVYWIITEELLREQEELSHRVTIYKFNVEYGDQSQRQKWSKALEIINSMITENDNLIWAASESIRQLAKIVELDPRDLLARASESVKERLNWQHHNLDTQTDQITLSEKVDMYFQTFLAYWPTANI